jgi:hypothetical protein
MAIAVRIQEIFAYFENLNLLSLIEDLRQGQTTRQGWSTGRLLCPIAHGLPTGDQVRELNMLGQALDLSHGCEYAARHLGAHPSAVLRFVQSWDDQTMTRDWLLFQLEELWFDRLENAQAVQEMLHPEMAVPSDDSPREKSLREV